MQMKCRLKNVNKEEERRGQMKLFGYMMKWQQ